MSISEKSHRQQPSDDITLFNQIFNNYRSRFILFAKSYVRDDFIAEDIVMESLMSFWQKRKELSPDVNIYAYITTVIKNKSLNYLEHQRIVLESHEKMQQHESRELNFRISTLKSCDPEALFVAEIREIIDKTFDSLSEQSRTIFRMSRFENVGNKEIAERLDVSVKTVEFHITKVLKILRINLKDYLISAWLLNYLISSYFINR